MENYAPPPKQQSEEENRSAESPQGHREATHVSLPFVRAVQPHQHSKATPLCWWLSLAVYTTTSSLPALATRDLAPASRNSNPALDLVNSHSIVPFWNSYVILSKQFFIYFMHTRAKTICGF